MTLYMPRSEQPYNAAVRSPVIPALTNQETTGFKVKRLRCMTVTKCCTGARVRDTIHTVLQSPHVGMAVVPALTNQETTGQRSRD